MITLTPADCDRAHVGLKFAIEGGDTPSLATLLKNNLVCATRGSMTSKQFFGIDTFVQ
jgi:hypothetical protein